MKNKLLSLSTALLLSATSFAQNPVLTSWLLNQEGTTGRHYIDGNSTPQTDTSQVNIQKIQFSDDYVYINASGFPSYIVGPYLDNNPSYASNNDWLFQIPFDPQPNTGTLTSTPFGGIGVFINGVPMYDYKDGISYKFNTQTKTGEDASDGDGVWNRNAILAENDGFDCAKGHPSPIFEGSGPTATLVGGTYHHHQNPTAYNLDLVQISDICDLYLADGLYTLDSTKHSPLIGFAFDGYPVYGAYGYADPNDANSAIALVMSSYQKRNMIKRTRINNVQVAPGPDVSTDYPLGWYKEDYEFIENSGALDEHNGRFCITPEYPAGTYAYFATVDENWNSAYPYIVGPEYYGIVLNQNYTTNQTTSINEPVTPYEPLITAFDQELSEDNFTVFPQPATDVVAVQFNGLLRNNLVMTLFNMNGVQVQQEELTKGSTVWHLNTQTLYNGTYLLKITGGEEVVSKKIVIARN